MLQDTRDLLNAMIFMERGGKTNTSDALAKARTDVLTSAGGDRAGISNTVVLVTDGGSNVNVDDTIPQADLLKVRVPGTGRPAEGNRRITRHHRPIR